jgi:phospholipid/cholesterol/gamma-HCH transport system substrate-binding protein
VSRALPVVAVLLAAAALAAVLLLREEEEGYRVRAIFDNAGFVIPGEDVRVAGVRVGHVEAVEVTPDVRAALVLRIEDAAHRDFRADAECLVRPQSLIGERFVECEPTQARGADAAAPPPLRRIARGPGEGQHLLPVERTGTTVDLDLINSIMREPYRERLSIILNELGTGVAGRGRDLDAVIRRANPALREIDEVLALLARQNAELSSLAVNADTVLAPLARERRRVGSAIDNVGQVAAAIAERRADLEAGLERLPRFLAELRPTMRRLGALAGEATPVLADVGAVAPELNTLLRELGPFSGAATTALESLGEEGLRSIPAVRAARPLAVDLTGLGRAVRPVGRTLGDVLQSFQRQDGIEHAMDFLFYGVSAINGYDAFGHYLRASLIVNQCSNYAIAPVAGCTANFPDASSSAVAAADAPEPVAAAAPAPLAAAAPAGSDGAAALSAEDAALLDYLFGRDE